MNFCGRRKFIRGGGACIALPFLESFAKSKRKTIPKRFVFLGFGFGITNETWYPDIKQKGRGYTLPRGLEALKAHKKNFSIIQGCYHKYTKEPHWGSTFWLTGANRYAIPGKSFSNSISVDQVAAQYLGQDTRFASIQLGSKDFNASGHGPGLSLAWDQQGKPVACIDTPLKLYHKLFSEDKLPIKQRKILLKQQRSVLDTVLLEAKRIQRGVSQHDRDKLDEYFQSIRDIEIQLNKREAWMNIPKAKTSLQEPNTFNHGNEEIQLMYKLIVAAFKTDSTRVISYRQPVASLLKSLGITVNPHNMSHYVPGERRVASEKRDHAQSELLSKLIDQLKATSEQDGSTLFDHTTLVYGSNIRSIHYMDNCPTLVSGRGANLKLGENIVLKKNTPLCNVWLSLLKGSNLPVDQFGDSTGLIPELMA